MRLFSVLALAALLSGCFNFGHQEPRWGLGLDTSVTPEPVPFSESPDDLNHLFALANASIEALYGRCTTNSKESWVRGQAREWNWNAFDYLVNACDENDHKLLEAEARNAIANGTVAELAAKYQDELAAVWDRVRPMLDAFPPPGTYADAEFQGWLQQEAGTASGGIRVGRQFLGDYYNHTGEPFNNDNLDTALINLRGSTRALDALEYLMRHYEWQPGVCKIPSAQAIYARQIERFNRTVQLASTLADPEGLKNISNPYGYMVKNLGPRLQRAYELDRPLLLLFIQPELDFYEAYWQNYTHQPYPNYEEGQYLIALHHSKVRSLATEDRWDRERYFVGQSEADWYDSPVMAVRPVALQAVYWTFAGIRCTGTGLAETQAPSGGPWSL